MPFPCAFPLCTRLSAFPYWQTRVSPEEGLEKAVEFLKDVIIKSDKPKTISWA